MADRLSQVILRYKLDDNSLDKAQQSVNRLSENIVKLGNNADKTKALVSVLGGVVQTLGKTRAAIDLADQFYNMDNSIGNAQQRAELMVKTLKEVGATKDDIADAVAEFTRLANTEQDNALGGLKQNIFSKVQRAAGGVGLGPLADIAGFADDFSDLGEALSAAGVAVGPLVASLAPLAAAAGLVAAGFVAVTQVFRDGAREIDKGIQRLQTYYDTIGEGTTESINAQIKALNQQKALDYQFAQRIQETLDTLRNQGEGGLTEVGRSLVRVFGAEGLRTKLTELGTNITTAEEKLLALNDALKSSEVASNDAAEAAKKKAEIDKQAAEDAKRLAEEAAREQKRLLDEQTNQQADAIRRRIEIDSQLDELKAKGSSKDVAEEAQRINQLAIAREKELNALYALPNQSEQTQRRIKDLEDELADLDYQAQRLDSDIRETVDARQKELDSYEKLKKSLSDISKGVTDAATKAASLGKGILEAVGKAGQDRLKIETKAAEDIARINEQAAEKRADLEKRYQENIVNITEQAAESAAKALDKLKQSQADLKRDLDRDTASTARKQADEELQARIDYAREDEKALRDHLTNLKRIREDAQDREFEQALNRDFASLFFSRRDTTKQLTRSNEDFNAERQQRQLDLQNRLADMRVQAAQEARERQIQYQQRLADARAAYERERVDIEANRQQQLAKARANYATDQAELSANLAKQIAARRTAYRTELDELNKALAAKIKAELAAQSSLITGATKTAGIISGIFNAIGSLFKAPTPAKRAGGGPLGAGVLAAVNEPGSSGAESWMSGGKRYAFPGPGLFLPTQAGVVDANKGGGGKSVGSISMPINISGVTDPVAVGKIVEQKVASALNFVFGD